GGSDGGDLLAEDFDVRLFEIWILAEIGHHLSRYLLLEVLDYVGEVTSPESSFVKRVPQLVILVLTIVSMQIAERPLDRPGDVQPHEDNLGVERSEKLFPRILEEGDVPHTTFRRQSFGAPHRPASIVPVLLPNGIEPFAVDHCVSSCAGGES